MRTVALAWAAVWAMTPASASARLVEDWSYIRLFQEADLVVIARPVKSVDAGDRLKRNPWRADLIGVNTSFKTVHTLKGAAKAPVTVLHYRTDALLQNGPLLVKFRTKAIRYTIVIERREGEPARAAVRKFIGEAGPATYLLFLKRRDDGRYEPVSGPIDPALSVRELREPIPFE